MEMPAFLAPIANAPRPQKIIFGVFGLAIIGAASWFLLLSPLSTRVEGLRTKHATLERDLIQARAIAADVARFRRDIAALETTLAALTERLPNERETPRLYRAVTDAAYQAGLAVTLFQPQGAQVRDYYSEIPIAFVAEGNYHQFGSFLERVALLPRVVNVGDLKVTGIVAPPRDPKAPAPAAAAGPVRGELVLSIYTYRPVGSPPVPKAPGVK
jgi:type IV pilus assembly protein PilO